MIIVKLVGGLGNQLFIYAFGRSLAHDLDEELYLDISRFGFNIHIEHLVYGLHPYNIKGVVGNYSPEAYKIRSPSFFSGDMKIYENGGFLTLRGRFYKNLLFDNMKNLKFPAYITGDFMRGYDNDDRFTITENFFRHNKDIIHEDLQYLLELTDEYKDIVEDMNNHDSIAINLRRGDYKNHPEFGLCSADYFNNAIEEIVKDLDNPKFFIFTEDHEWAEEHLIINYPFRHVVFNKDNNLVGNGYSQLLKAMSSCDHFIISNSTFAWWGAWLGENPNKKIIAPRPWFQSRDFLEAETIDGIKPMSIDNNYESSFNNSNNVLFKLNEKSNFSEIRNVDITYNNSMLVRVIGDNPKMVLSDKFNSSNKLIVKISLKSFAKNQFSLYYKRIGDEDFSGANSFYVWYYDNEKFTHYVILPEDISQIMIRPANESGIFLFLNELEIRELDENEDI